MREVRHLVGYVVALAMVGVSLAFAALFGFEEAVGYLPVASLESHSADRGVELAAAPTVRDADALPVWIVPTPRYQYDPKLMIVKSKEERQREAELRRAKELASYQAKNREARLRRERNLRLEKDSFAYAAEHRRPDFQVYPFNVP